MKRLCKALSVEEKINRIEKESIEKALLEVYKDEKYKFYLNSELIDVNDRFRIFNFDKKNYISKKTTCEDGFNEVKLATEAKKRLNNVNVGDYVIEIVEPSIYKVNDEYYIVTEYMGTSLQENAYCTDINELPPIETIFEVLDKFMELGVLYRGFLPRNTIVNKKNIFLLDWEDSMFLENSDVKEMNTLWKTNFLLNWSYIYDINILKEKLKKYEINKIKEPKLLKYEINFGKWIKSNENDIELRNKILETVIFAEKKFDIINEKFFIMPNDLAHLISDLFNSDIDVLFDITCFILRKKSNETYYKIIEILSNLIIELYYNKKEIQPYAIIVILMLFEIAYEDNYKTKEIINLYNNQNELFSNINTLNFKLIYKYNSKQKKEFKKELKKKLNYIIDEYNGEHKNIELINDISDYIMSFK